MNPWILAWIISTIVLSEIMYIIWAIRDGVSDFGDAITIKFPSIIISAIINGVVLLVLYTAKDNYKGFLVYVGWWILGFVALLILFGINYLIGRWLTQK